jgi:Holliday junction resolvase RusA-like endonuclease
VQHENGCNENQTHDQHWHWSSAGANWNKQTKQQIDNVRKLFHDQMTTLQLTL